MPSPTHADHAAARPPDPGAVDALISQARQLRTRVDSVLGESPSVLEDPQVRWQRALCDLAVHQLDDLGAHLGQLREGIDPDAPPGTPRAELPGVPRLPDPAEPDRLPDPSAAGTIGRAGSAEWDLLTDGVQWSDELYRVFGRSP